MDNNNEYENGEVFVCNYSDVEPNTIKRFVLEDLAIVLIRIDADSWYALEDRCTHQDVLLSEGYLDNETLSLECSKHGSCFSLETGEPDSLPATEPVRIFPVKIAEDKVWIITT